MWVLLFADLGPASNLCDLNMANTWIFNVRVDANTMPVVRTSSKPCNLLGFVVGCSWLIGTNGSPCHSPSTNITNMAN